LQGSLVMRELSMLSCSMVCGQEWVKSVKWVEADMKILCSMYYI